MKTPLSRKVSKESLITVDGIKYSVPSNYIGKLVTVEVVDNKIIIYHNNLIISSHNVSTSKFNYDENHYKELLKYCVDESSIYEICKKNLSLLDGLL